MIRTFADHLKQSHTLDLDTVLVDGAQFFKVQATEHAVEFETAQGTITCELGQFWHAIAGPDLSAQEAGLLLVDCLVRQVVIQRTSSALHEVMCLLTRAAALPAEIPSSAWLTTRLDPLAQKAMSAYDGSDAMTEVIARIVQQSPATIRLWARQLGLDASPVPVQSGEVTATPVVAPVEVAASEDLGETTEVRKQFNWTPERLQQLEHTLETCTAPTVVERARQIAERCDWPVEKVRSKLYDLQKPARRPGQAAARETEHAEAEQEGDRHAERLEAVPV